MKKTLATLAVTVAVMLVPVGARAQDTPQVIEIGVEGVKIEAPPVKVSVRPNTPIALGFELKNRSKDKDTFRDVTVRLVTVEGTQERIFAEAVVKELPPTPAGGRGPIVLQFGKIKGGPDKLEFAAQPFKFQLQIEARVPKDFVTLKRDIVLVVREPREYIPPPTANYDQKDKQLRFVFAYPKKDDIIGPPIFPVQLVLSPELKQTKNGIFNGMMRKPNEPIDLLADNVAPEAGFREGDAWLKVDNYDRAFTYPVKLGGSGTPEARSATEIRCRINAPRYAKPSDKFDVLLEMDGPLADDYHVHIGYDPIGKARFRDERELIGLRQQTMLVGFSKEGVVVCQSTVSDWKVRFDTTGISRDIWFRVYVTKKDAKTGLYEKVKVAYPDETTPLLAKIETEPNDAVHLYARVSQGESTPGDMRFVDLPKEAALGSSLDVRVKIRPRTPEEAPISRVIFFYGKAPKDDKEKLDIIATDDTPDPKRTEWTFKLPSPAKADPVTMSVMFITRTGEKAVLTETIGFKEGTPGKGGSKIVGVVRYGDDTQRDLAVVLLDAKRNVKGTAKSDAKGVFVFEDVAPGVYTVQSSRSFLNLRGETGPITIPDPKTKVVRVVVDLLTK